jgi:hypothetical protein
MSVISFPSDILVEEFTFGQRRNDAAFSSVFGSQAVEVSVPLWTVSLSTDKMSASKTGIWQGMILKLNGQINQLALHNMGRPVPIGDYRGSPLISANAAQGSTSLTFTDATQADKYFIAGDMIGVGSGDTRQLLMITDNAIANAFGAVTVSFSPPLRVARVVNEAVIWDAPTALFRSEKGSVLEISYNLTMASKMSISLIEDFRP